VAASVAGTQQVNLGLNMNTMNSLLRVVVLLGMALLSGTALAQAVSSADVNIVSIEAQSTKKGFLCTVLINNQNDDDAYDTRVLVLLPLQTPKVRSATVTGGSGKCKPHAPFGTPTGFVEVVQCDLGHLPQGPTVRRTVTVTADPSTADPVYKRTCSALIYSPVGDIDKTNNYAAATAP